MQILTIAGNVGKDATLRRTQGGDAVLSFSLAVDNGKDRQGNKRDSTWYDCSLWGARADSLERHIVKGVKLTLSGQPTVRAHDGKAYLGIRVDQLTFMGGGRDRDDSGQQDGSGYGSGGRPSGGNRSGYSPDRDAEIPFAPSVL